MIKIKRSQASPAPTEPNQRPPPPRSKNELEQRNHHDQANQENDAYGAAKEFQHKNALIGWA
ncbi:hypothetical protein HU715_006025 [Pseudomonas sp. SWRI12]|uniref:Uncharacterized protein n=1 Tax=Pseudomonas zanjanensis TaxID=2745496 RepID=A0A923FEK7_9PSED|nr:hypothetical protein [Pseudomonas zanjanensis]MBV4494909.1 hypothetical protein [Pseudomonas zanjanensis]